VCLLPEVVDLVHYAVDLVRQARALPADGAVEAKQASHSAHHLAFGTHRKMQLGKIIHHLGVTLEGWPAFHEPSP